MTGWSPGRILRRGRPAIALGLVPALALQIRSAISQGGHDPGANAHPVRLVRPPSRPLSAVAQLGRSIFFDRALSASGRLACATCHSPQYAYGPPNDRSVQLGGSGGHEEGHRAVPSLRYLDRVPGFAVGPAGSDDAEMTRPAPASSGPAPRPQKIAGASVGTVLVPRGGLFWDGRASTLQQQAMAPLFSPVEMANTDPHAVADRLARAPYARSFAVLFGQAALSDPDRLIDEAMFAVGRFEIEDPSFHPYRSKYDDWLEGKATLTGAELRGLAAFEDPSRGNCAACHPSRPLTDGRPPTFTDFEYEALGVPRNRRISDNRNGAYFDLGLCGPIRDDLARQTAYCGMFRTPSLRNVATRSVFFHNGVYHSIQDALSFYAFRAVAPERIYPRRANGTLALFDDLPEAYRSNVDVADAPFDRRPGAVPPLTAQEQRDIVAFLRTLTDQPKSGAAVPARR